MCRQIVICDFHFMGVRECYKILGRQRRHRFWGSNWNPLVWSKCFYPWSISSTRIVPAILCSVLGSGMAVCSTEGEMWESCQKARGQKPAFSLPPLEVRHSLGSGDQLPLLPGRLPLRFLPLLLSGYLAIQLQQGDIFKKEFFIVHLSGGRWNWHTFWTSPTFPVKWRISGICLLGAHHVLPTLTHPNGFVGEFI